MFENQAIDSLLVNPYVINPTSNILNVSDTYYNMATLNLLREYVKLIIEAPVPLRKPETLDQQVSFIRLLQWAASRMGAPKEMVTSAVSKAVDEDDWDEAIELLRDFYVLKGIEFKAT